MENNICQGIGRGNRSTRSKLTPVPFCQPQIPRDQTWARTRAAAVGNRRPTVWAMAQPTFQLLSRTTVRTVRTAWVQARRGQRLFLFLAPRFCQMGTGCSRGRSAHQVCFVSVTSLVLISIMLMEDSSGVPQSLDSSALGRPRPFHILPNT
jgi:hypothetical protein